MLHLRRNLRRDGFSLGEGVDPLPNHFVQLGRLGAGIGQAYGGKIAPSTA